MSWIKLAIEFIIGLFGYKKPPVVDKTQSQEATILKNQRDNQITSVEQADAYENTWNGH